jgi:MFS family permease
LMAASQNVAMLCVGRVICGLCVGICSAIVPVYQSEIAPKEIRGRVVSLQQWAITWGILMYVQTRKPPLSLFPPFPNDTRC